MALKYDGEIELKSPTDVVWSAIKDLNFLFPKALPEIYQGIEILEGNGRSAGTLSLITENGPDSSCTYKLKIESVDEVNKTMYYRLIEGELLNYYKFFDKTLTVKAKGEGSVLHWSCMYEKATTYAPNAEIKYREIVNEIYQKLDAYLLSINKN